MKLTIKYVYANGNIAKPSTIRTYSSGYSYNVKSPVLTGYIPDKDRVTGVLTEDTEIIVTYTEVKYTLTVKYVYINGTNAAPAKVSELAYREKYNIESPTIQGYTSSRKYVSGTMPARNVTVTVYYNESIPNGDIGVIEDLDTPL